MPQIYEKSSEKQFYLSENHPVVSLIYLLLLMLLGAIIFGLASIFIVIAQGYSFTDLQGIIGGGDPNQLVALRIIQTGSSLGTFLIPALIMSRIESKRTHYLDFALPRSGLVWLFAAILMFVSGPLLELLGSINQHLRLPPFLSDLESWMQSKESNLEELTKLMLHGTRYTDLLFNLFMVAVVPAIGEELIFRGILQNIITRWTKRVHSGIWLTAIIFSTIHFQFYGFLPRLLMGVLFGYLLFWTRTIWIPILAHFVNNATVVIYSFILQKQGKSLDTLSDHQFINPIWYILSFLATTALLYYFWKYSHTRNVSIKQTEQIKNGS